MSHTIDKHTEKGEIRLTITVPAADYAKDLEIAAVRLSERATIPGFRKGKAPYETVRRAVGDMAILQEAIDGIIRRSYSAAVTAEGLETIGMPQVQVEKIAPGNDVVYTATAAVLPAMTLPILDTIRVERKERPIDDAVIRETIDALRGIQAKETIRSGPARKEDKVVVDMAMSLDRVPVDGGQTKNYGVYLGEKHYIPGFNDALIGVQKGDKKEFRLRFPETHYQRMLAGKEVDIAVIVGDVFARVLPEVGDAFAATMGQPTMEALTHLVRQNREAEEKQKADERAEANMLEQLIENTSFETIPEPLIDAERRKMFTELTRDLERHGVSIEQYLQDIKKKEDELLRDFLLQATKRAKAALLLRHFAKTQGIRPSKEEIDTELSRLRSTYKEDPTALQNLSAREVRDTISTLLQNRKVMAWLTAKIMDNTKQTPPA